MKSLETLKKRTAELLKEKAERLDAAEKEIQATADEAAKLEAEAAEAHAARDYAKEIELQEQAAKIHKVKAEYEKDKQRIAAGVLIDLDEYESTAAEVMKDLKAMTAANQKKICKLLTEMKQIKEAETETINDANEALKVWQFDINGARDVERYGERRPYKPWTLLAFNDMSNEQYLAYILETGATEDYIENAK